MRLSSLPAILAAAAFFLAPVRAGAQERAQVYREAVNLYENGIYEHARTLFESLEDPLGDAYALLCAIRSRSSDYPDLLKTYEARYPESVLSSAIHFEIGQHLFDSGEYEAAAGHYAMVNEGRLQSSQLAEYCYKSGYCAAVAGKTAEAREWMTRVESMPGSRLAAAASYQLGYLDYSEKSFGSALDWFSRASSDSRFGPLAEYYILECRFMEKDYAYVTENGPGMLETVPAERRQRLSRIISESYMVLGDEHKALEFYNMEGEPEELSRADLFHAGSVKFAVQDYAGAIASFSRMESRIDSLGQVANYNLGWSYIQTGNKVAAADAFKDAAEVGYDASIQADAFFNHAKLCFDLNGDTSVFGAYLQQYPQTARKEQIYNYMAIAALNSRDYAAAIEAYSNIEELDEGQKLNYTKANYLRAGQLLSGGSWADASRCFQAASFHLPKEDPLWQLSRYWLAETSFAGGDYAKAATIYNELYNLSALDGRPEGALLPYNIGCSLFNQKKYDGASKWFDKYIADKDAFSRKDAMLRRADCDFARHDYVAAVRNYGKVLDEFNEPDDIYPYYQQALAYGLSGDRMSKVSVLSRVQGASSDAAMYPEAMYELGRAYMDIDKNSLAAGIFSRLASSTSDRTWVARAMIGEGMAYRNMKNYDQALARYKGVVSLMPGSEYSEEALMAINSIYQTTNQPEKYLEYIESNGIPVGKTAAERESVYFNTAEQIYLSGNYKRASEALLKYLGDYPLAEKRGDAWFYLADSNRGLGNKEKACEAYLAAVNELKEGPFAESAALNYARISYELEHYADSYSGYGTLLEIAKMDENRLAARRGRMKAAFAGRSYEEAIAAAREFRSTQPSVDDEREADYVEARSLLATSRRDEAFRLFEKLAQQPSTPEGAESAYMLIRNHCDSGEYDKVEKAAFDFAGKCGEQSYWLAKAYIVLGEAFAAKGNPAQARATWESIRDGYHPGPEGDDILETVNQKLATL